MKTFSVGSGCRWLVGLLLFGILLSIGCGRGGTAEVVGQEKIALPETDQDYGLRLEETLAGRRSIRNFSQEPLNMLQLSRLLWAAQGMSDKQRGLRTAPSAGALYPLELYVLASRVEGLSSGLYRYLPAEHSLLPHKSEADGQKLAEAALGQKSISQAAAVFVFSAVYERTRRRYGRRTERYVHIEAGHAAQNLCLQAVSLGLDSVPIGAFDDGRVKRLLSLPAAEDPLYILPVGQR